MVPESNDLVSLYFLKKKILIFEFKIKYIHLYKSYYSQISQDKNIFIEPMFFLSF